MEIWLQFLNIRFLNSGYPWIIAEGFWLQIAMLSRVCWRDPNQSPLSALQDRKSEIIALTGDIKIGQTKRMKKYLSSSFKWELMPLSWLTPISWSHKVRYSWNEFQWGANPSPGIDGRSFINPDRTVICLKFQNVEDKNWFQSLTAVALYW